MCEEGESRAFSKHVLGLLIVASARSPNRKPAKCTINMTPFGE